MVASRLNIAVWGSDWDAARAVGASSVSFKAEGPAWTALPRGTPGSPQQACSSTDWETHESFPSQLAGACGPRHSVTGLDRSWPQGIKNARNASVENSHEGFHSIQQMSKHERYLPTLAAESTISERFRPDCKTNSSSTFYIQEPRDQLKCHVWKTVSRSIN